MIKRLIVLTILSTSSALAQQLTDDQVKKQWEECTLHYEQPSSPQTKGYKYKTPIKFMLGWESCAIIGDEFAKRTEMQTEEIKKKALEDIVKKIK